MIQNNSLEGFLRDKTPATIDHGRMDKNADSCL
jgi:hypothetical protein